MHVSQVPALVDQTLYPMLIEEYQGIDLVYPRICDVLPWDDRYMLGERIDAVVDFGEPDEIEFGMEAPSRQTENGWKIYSKTRKYAHKFEISMEEMAAIDSIGRLGERMEAFFRGTGAAFARKKEAHIANMVQDGTLTAGNVSLFDGSFVGETDPYPTLGYDGQPFFDTAHNLVLSSTTPANHVVTSALSEANIQTQLSLMESTSAVDERGRPIQNPMDTLIVPVGLEWTARVLLESALKAGSANNDKNLLQNRLDLIVWRELSKTASASSWWLAGTRPGAPRAIRVRDSGEPRVRMWEEQRTGMFYVEVYSYWAAQVQNWRRMGAFNKAAS